jgi:hypothetical protein
MVSSISLIELIGLHTSRLPFIFFLHLLFGTDIFSSSEESSFSFSLSFESV